MTPVEMLRHAADLLETWRGAPASPEKQAAYYKAVAMVAMVYESMLAAEDPIQRFGQHAAASKGKES